MPPNTDGAIAKGKLPRLIPDLVEAKGGQGRNGLAFFPDSASIADTKAAPGADVPCEKVF